MRQIKIGGTTLILSTVLISNLVFGAGETDILSIHSFESSSALAKLTCNNIRIEQVEAWKGQKGHAVKVDFEHVNWPNITLKHGLAYDQKDWSQYSALAIDVYNPEKESIKLAVRVDDDPSADGAQHCITGNGGVAPGQAATLVMPLTKLEDLNMRGIPLPVPNGIALGVSAKEIDLSNIVAFQLFLPLPEREHTLYIDNIRLMQLPEVKKITDQYGQYTGGTWPGKISDDSDLRAQDREEIRWLEKNKPQDDRDMYGGWTKGPRLQASGFFRTAYIVRGKETHPPAASQEQNGRWWLVTPNGYLFYSIGMDCVWYSESSKVTGREQLFTWLPEISDPLSKFMYGEDPTRIDFYGMNLTRKYGLEWRPIWKDRTIERLSSWGFNTIGNWSNWDMFRMRKIPYTVAAHISQTNLARIGSDEKSMIDVFDPKFEEEAELSIERVTKEWKDDPWCLGYFVDNELPWGGWGDDIHQRCALAFQALSQTDACHAKQVFLKDLQDKYNTIEDLAKAWKIEAASWDAFINTPVQLPADLSEECKKDLEDFTRHFAGHYFSTVAQNIRKYDPHHLYLGCRFSSRPIDVVRVSAEHCDVVTFNLYQKTIDAETYGFTSTLGKPCLIGEFHFGALDRGMFSGGLGPVQDQAARGRAYADYARSVWELPAFVGHHWFQYLDEPLTGRFDGENYNIGFISFTDRPHWELVEAARDANFAVYEELTSK